MAKKKTKKVVKKSEVKKEAKKTNSKDPWGRKLGSQSATINSYLNKGSTVDDIMKKEGYPRSRITSHIKFLKTKDFKLTEKDGVVTLHEPKS